MVGADGGRALESADPINPQRLFFELAKRLPDGAILTSDSGSSANWYARDVRIRKGMMASLSGNLATMGPGVPYAIAAKFAHPGPRRDRAGRRRGDADERHGRDDHDRQVLGALVGSAPDRARAPQQRPEPGHLGAAGDGGRSHVRRVPDDPRLPLRRLRRVGRPARASGSTIRTRSGRHGTMRFRPIGRPCSRRSPIPSVPPLPPHITFEQAVNFSQAVIRRATPDRRGDDHPVVQAEGAATGARPALIPGRQPTANRCSRDVSTSRSRRSTSPSTPSRPTSRSRTGPRSGTRRRSCSSRRMPATRSGSATPTVNAAAGALVRRHLTDAVEGRDAIVGDGELGGARHAPAATSAVRASRRWRSPAVDTALWDLKARLLELPLATLLDAAHEAVPIYGSGGFTSYSDAQLSRAARRLGRAGDPAREDEGRPRAGTRPRTGSRSRARRSGPRPSSLSTRTAPSAASRRCWFAVEYARALRRALVRGARLARTTWTACACSGTGRLPGMEIAAGEYGYMLPYFERMLAAGAVDCLQADVTRCEGITGFLRVAALCQARSLQLSAHCGPSIHVHPCCAVVPLRHLEYFHDHVADRAAASSTACSSRWPGSCVPTSPAPETGSSSSAPTPRPTRSRGGMR